MSSDFDSQTSPPSTNPQNAPLTPNRVIPLAAVRKVSAGASSWPGLLKADRRQPTSARINARPAIPMISAVDE